MIAIRTAAGMIAQEIAPTVGSKVAKGSTLMFTLATAQGKEPSRWPAS